MKSAKRCMAVLMTSMMVFALLAVGVAVAQASGPAGTGGCCASGGGGGGGGGSAAGGAGPSGGGGDGAGSGSGGGPGGGAGAGGAGRTATSGFLTPAQEFTFDAFNACAAPYPGAQIETLSYDGRFTFTVGLRSESHAIKACMAERGFNFDW